MKTGEIIKIHPLKSSRNGGTSYVRAEFKMEDGSWAKTDVVPGFRNASRWVPILKAGVGAFVTGLQFKRDGEVDADSFPRVTTVFSPTEKVVKKEEIKLVERVEVEQVSLFA